MSASFSLPGPSGSGTEEAVAQYSRSVAERTRHAAAALLAFGGGQGGLDAQTVKRQVKREVGKHLADFQKQQREAVAEMISVAKVRSDLAVVSMSNPLGLPSSGPGPHDKITRHVLQGQVEEAASALSHLRRNRPWPSLDIQCEKDPSGAFSCEHVISSVHALEGAKHVPAVMLTAKTRVRCCNTLKRGTVRHVLV